MQILGFTLATTQRQAWGTDVLQHAEPAVPGEPRSATQRLSRPSRLSARTPSASFRTRWSGPSVGKTLVSRVPAMAASISRRVALAEKVAFQPPCSSSTMLETMTSYTALGSPSYHLAAPRPAHP